jgi:hypothetical protein
MRMKDKHRRLARKRFWGDHDRSEYECPDCGRTESEVERFEVHHKDGDAHNNSINNLVGLCTYCHCVREDRKPPMEAIMSMRDVRDSDHSLSDLDPRVVEFVREQTGEPPHENYVEPLGMLLEEFEQTYDKRVSEQIGQDLEMALREIRDAEVGFCVFEGGESVFVEGIWYCG